MLQKLVVILPLLGSLCFSQTSEQASTSLQSAVSASIGLSRPSSIRLEGTAIEHAGVDETGAFIATVDSSGRMNLRLNMNSGLREEQGSGLSEDPECGWIAADGTKHEIPLHNCWSLNNWLVPMVSGGLDSPKISYSTKVAEKPVIDFKRDMGSSTKTTSTTRAAIEKLSEFRVVLSPKTLLPDSLEFTAHPDDDANVDIPVVIRYSDYRTVNGVAVPFHIEKSLNGAVLLELTVTSATVGGSEVSR